MPESEAEADALEMSYPLRTAARLTGLSPEVLRAWERRHSVVTPMRTPGGTRRYSAADLERLRLVKAAIDAGHRIGEVASLGNEELKHLAGQDDERSPQRQDHVLEALDRMDGARAQHLLTLQLAALGPARFARELASPLLQEIGLRWARDEMGIASEHLASAVIRSMLGSALQPSAASLRGPIIVFATPSGERHELGLLMAATTALGAGANPVYLGADLPVEDVLGAVARSGARALALSVVTLAAAEAERSLAALRQGLPGSVLMLAGGAGARNLSLPDRVEHIDQLEDLERRIELLAMDDPSDSSRRSQPA